MSRGGGSGPCAHSLPAHPDPRELGGRRGWDLETHRRAVELRKQGLTLVRIGEALGVPPSTLSRWFRGGRPHEARYAFSPGPEKRSALAYILGILDSDGWISYDRANGCYYFGVDTSTDEPMLIERVSKVVKHLLGKEGWKLTIDNVIVFEENVSTGPIRRRRFCTEKREVY